MDENVLDPSQERAVELLRTASFGVVTGGPGTGKTTCLRVALDHMDRARETYALAAPTGKAAKRMSEATLRPAKTIHRLLAWKPDGFCFNQHNPLTCNALIIDEASMLDVELAASLVEALEPRTRLILVGDANQLPSVGPGRVLADLVESDIVPVARLTQVHRAAAKSWICRNAPRVLTGESLELETAQDFRFVEAETPEDVARAVVDVVTTPEFASAQVLSPQRTTACGVEALNQRLQQRLNPERDQADQWSFDERVIRLRDRVIQTVNDYKLEVFNGEVGTVMSVTPTVLQVNFGDRCVAYSRSEAMNLRLAYALTVHRYQGSETPWAVCVVHSAHTHMLTRQLFYTAITRAKKGVVLIGNRQGLVRATSDKAPPKRNTMLVERLREQLGLPPTA